MQLRWCVFIALLPLPFQRTDMDWVQFFNFQDQSAVDTSVLAREWTILQILSQSQRLI